MTPNTKNLKKERLQIKSFIIVVIFSPIVNKKAKSRQKEKTIKQINTKWNKREENNTITLSCDLEVHCRGFRHKCLKLNVNRNE